MAAKLTPYQRSIRPTLPESLGQYIDAEFQKIAVATSNIVQALASLEARVAALEPQ